MRWIEINLETFAVRQSGFSEHAAHGRAIFHSGSLGHATRIEDIKDAEYAQLVVVDTVSRTVAFGRDYLGHYPLTYGYTDQTLLISDSYSHVHGALRARGASFTISEEALALFFTMGFVPHGRSIYREIVNCEATGYYLWQNRSVRRVNLFEPIAISASESIGAIGEAIEAEVDRYAKQSDRIDIWCSGGLDSSIMAMRFNAKPRQADIITLAYGHAIHEQYGDGERRFARTVAQATQTHMRDVDLSPQQFDRMHTMFAETHNGPVMDFPLPPKYSLAQATRELAITGEAGDTFFGGTKNASIMYAHHKQPDAGLGRLYAVAHNRYFKHLKEIFKRGEQLETFAVEHCDKLTQAYPGDVQRKLFYLNSHEKLGGMIFAQSYFPSQVFGIRVRHPIASLGVYKASFAVPDHRKFSYPFSKIALIELYREQLPPVIVQRKKSGTQLPLAHYLKHFSPEKFDFSPLRETGFFRDAFLDKISAPSACETVPPLLLYACTTLNHWLKHKERHHVKSIPTQTGHHQ